jgi:hypothetical protein
MTIELDIRERNLLRKYGYPFEVLGRALDEAKGRQGVVDIDASAFDWEQAVGNLSISVNEDVRSASLAEELDCLASRIEWELQQR